MSRNFALPLRWMCLFAYTTLRAISPIVGVTRAKNGENASAQKYPGLSGHIYKHRGSVVCSIANAAYFTLLLTRIALPHTITRCTTAQ
jgi:hypothetical protein